MRSPQLLAHTAPETPQVLIIPGWTNSGPEHWQSLWQTEHPEYVRVEQRDWDMPTIPAWVDTLDQAVCGVKDRHPIVLVAHSLGCLTVAHWAQQYPAHTHTIIGALLVAPPDIERPDTPSALHTFRPILRSHLPFPTVIAASTSDPFTAIDRAQEIARDWGARMVNVGDAGHVNTAAGVGRWVQGQEILNDILTTVQPSTLAALRSSE